jgi:hypothetical protein
MATARQARARRPDPRCAIAVGLAIAVGSCRLAGVDPREYLADVLPRLTGRIRLVDLPSLLPSRWAAQRAAGRARGPAWCAKATALAGAGPVQPPPLRSPSPHRRRCRAPGGRHRQGCPSCCARRRTKKLSNYALIASAPSDCHIWLRCSAHGKLGRFRPEPVRSA